MRGNGAEYSAAEGCSQRGAEPTATAQQIFAAGAATAGGGARGYTTAARETTFREDASRSVGVTGRRGTAAPVEVGPARGQPDQPRGAGEWGSYPGGGLGVGCDMPLSRHRKLGSCRKGVQPRKCTRTRTRVEFPIDGPKEQERQEYLAQVYLTERSVGRAPRVVRPSNDWGLIRPLPPPQ